MKTVTFEMNCSPFLAIRTLQQLSEDCKSFYSEASAFFLSGQHVIWRHSLKEASLKQKKLIQALK